MGPPARGRVGDLLELAPVAFPRSRESRIRGARYSATQGNYPVHGERPPSLAFTKRPSPAVGP